MKTKFENTEDGMADSSSLQRNSSFIYSELALPPSCGIPCLCLNLLHSGNGRQCYINSNLFSNLIIL